MESYTNPLITLKEELIEYRETERKRNKKGNTVLVSSGSVPNRVKEEYRESFELRSNVYVLVSST